MKTILGTMTFGNQVDEELADALLSTYKASGGTELDAAYIYNGGACETLLGACLKRPENQGFQVATKANPAIFGCLDSHAVTAQLNESLERLDMDCVDLFYLHAPDPATPLEETLEACARLHDQGKFRELGLSNYNTETVSQAIDLCDKLGCPRPTVFEGIFNALSRTAEDELLDALEGWGIRYYAYNPLAGGLLTGRYNNAAANTAEGRFAAIPTYKDFYWKESNFQALDILGKACAEAGIAMAEASYRWLANHSKLSKNPENGLIIGTSKLAQLEQNLASLQGGPLPQAVVDAFDQAWELARPNAISHYRPFKPQA